MWKEHFKKENEKKKIMFALSLQNAGDKVYVDMLKLKIN